MAALTDISVIKGLLTRYGFTFSKAMGQNFLINPSVCPKIAEMGGAKEGTGVIEIGPGLGVLTVELARRADKVVAIELDQRLKPVLEETLADFSNVSVRFEDVMKADLSHLIEEEFSGLEVVVCANLPYYITSPILMGLLESRLPVSMITVMVQREAALRLCAPPGQRECGAISAAIWYYAEPKLLFNVSHGSFMPAPEVDSAVIRLSIRQKPVVQVEDEKLFFRLVKEAFSQRRKTAVNAISSRMSIDKSVLTRVFNEISIPEGQRAERFSLEQFAALADALKRIL